MAGEREARKRTFEFYSNASDNPFKFSNVFYGSLVKMGYPIRFTKGAKDSLGKDIEGWSRVFIGSDMVAKVRSIYDKIFDYSTSAILDSAACGGSNEILLLLNGRDNEFYERYPSVKRKIPIAKDDLEACFMRGYEEWQKFLERDPISKNKGYPTTDETKMYRKLKAKGVTPISILGMQNLLIQVFKESFRRDSAAA